MPLYKRFTYIFFCCAFPFLANAQGLDTSLKLNHPFLTIPDSINLLSRVAIEKIGDTSAKGYFKNVISNNRSTKEFKNAMQEIGTKTSLFEKGKFITCENLLFEVDYSYLKDQAGTAIGALQGISGMFDYAMSYSLTVKNIPFSSSLRGVNGNYSFNLAPFNNFFKFNFDPETYRKTLLKSVSQKIDPNKVAAITLAKINSIRSQYESRLMVEIQKIQSEVKNQTGTIISLPENINDITTTDVATLQSRLIPVAELNKLNESQQILNNISSISNLTLSYKDSLYKDASNNVKRVEALNKILKAVSSWKDKFENNKTVADLKNNLPFVKDGFQNFLNKPGNLEKVIREQASLSSLQSIFLNITKLDIGKNPVNGNLFDVNNVVNSGVNMNFKTNDLGIGFIQGKNNNINQWLNAGLTSNITNEYSKLIGVQLGAGKSSLLNQSLSLNYFNFNDQLNVLNRMGNIQTPMTLPIAAHKDAVISIRTDIPLTSNHLLSVDLSKSLGSYTNGFTGDSSYNKLNPYNDVLGGSGSSNYAARIEYAGSFKQTEISGFIKKVGLGYNNPGNSTLHNGENQFGIGIIHRFIKNRITLKYNADFKTQTFDPEKNYLFTTINNKLLVSGQLNRFTKGSLVYQRTDYRSSMNGSFITPGKSNRLQLNGSYRIKMLHTKLINNFTGVHQEFMFPTTAGTFYRNTSLTFSHVSSLIMKSNLITLTIIANKSSSKDYLFNTSYYNTELNYSYGSNNFKLGTGFGYYDNSGWNQQIGLKQQVSALLGNKFSWDIEGGVKFAIRTVRVEFANQIYTSSHLRYNF